MPGIKFSFDESKRPFSLPLYTPTCGRSFISISVEVQGDEYCKPYFQEWISTLYTRLESGGQLNITIKA